MRVVHIAPGPDADLDDVGAGVDELAGAVGGHHVAGDEGRVGASGPDRLDDVEHLRLVPVGGVDHEDIGAHAHQLGGTTDRIGVDADCDRHQQAALGVDRRPVDGRAERTDRR